MAQRLKWIFSLLLSYFLFEGTARGDSAIKAEKLIEFDSPVDFNTWREYERIAAAKLIIDKVTISIRSKAMPDTYVHDATSERDKSIAIWTEYINGSYKGSLHIRG